jgi:hypothetical protein
MHKILIPSRSGSDWQRFLAKPTLHWRRGASAMTAAACWEAASSQLPPEIRQIFRTSGAATLSELELLMAVPEWEVALPGGATTSHTDVMAICRNEGGLVVIAVEAKVLEPFGETVGEKRSGASEGQLKRLRYRRVEVVRPHVRSAVLVNTRPRHSIRTFPQRFSRSPLLL